MYIIVLTLKIINQMSDTVSSNNLGHIITLAAVVFGWILGETTGLLKKRWSVCILKRSLYVEMTDALSWLKRNQITIEHIIQLTVLKEFIDFGPVKVPTHIYDKHFPEISPHLTSSERVSYNSIYNLIHRYHEDSSRLIELIRSEDFDKTKSKEYMGILEALYYNISMAVYQIQYHIANKDNLDVYSVTGEQANQINDSITNRIHEIRAEAKRLGLEEIKRRHNKT